MRHIDDTTLLEMLYLGDTTPDRATHLAECTACHGRMAALRTEIEADREGLEARVDAKPESFWTTQREEILSRARQQPRRYGLLRLRPALSAVMAVLLLAVGMMAIRNSTRPEVAPSDRPVAVVENDGELFEDEELRAYDPWETEELESFHQVVQWEEWIDEPASEPVPEEES